MLKVWGLGFRSYPAFTAKGPGQTQRLKACTYPVRGATAGVSSNRSNESKIPGLAGTGQQQGRCAAAAWQVLLQRSRTTRLTPVAAGHHAATATRIHSRQLLTSQNEDTPEAAQQRHLPRTCCVKRAAARESSALQVCDLRTTAVIATAYV